MNSQKAKTLGHQLREVRYKKLSFAIIATAAICSQLVARFTGSNWIDPLLVFLAFVPFLVIAKRRARERMKADGYEP